MQVTKENGWLFESQKENGMYRSVYTCIARNTAAKDPRHTTQHAHSLSVRSIGTDGSSQLGLPLVSVGEELLCNGVRKNRTGI